MSGQTAKKILILCYSKHASEPRVISTVNYLQDKYAVTTAGLAPLPGTAFIQLSGQMQARKEIRFHLGFPVVLRKLFSAGIKVWLKATVKDIYFSKADFDLLRKERFDLVIAHHPNTLELAVKLAALYKCEWLFNAHEYYPLEFESDAGWMRNYQAKITSLCSAYLHKATWLLAVNDPIGSFFAKNFGARYLPVPNSKPYHNLVPSQTGSMTRIIHHGVSNRERDLGFMIDAVEKSSLNAHFDLMLMPTELDYYRELLASEKQKTSFIDPVPFKEIITTLNKYDVGIYHLPAISFNTLHALPNKLFEFIQARVCIVISPNAAMAEIVKKYDLGIVTRDYSLEAFVEALDSLTAEKIDHHKKQCHKFAFELSDETNREKVTQAVQNILG